MRDKTRSVRVGVETSIAWVRISSRWTSWMIDRRTSTNGVGDSWECERTWYQSQVSESSVDKYTMKALTLYRSSRRVGDMENTRTRGNGMVTALGGVRMSRWEACESQPQCTTICRILYCYVTMIIVTSSTGSRAGSHTYARPKLN